MSRWQLLVLTLLFTHSVICKRHRQSADLQNVIYSFIQKLDVTCYLFDRTDERYLPSNLFFSPLSVHVLLAALTFGADRETYDELKDFVGPELTERELLNGYKELIETIQFNQNVTLDLANVLFVGDDVNVKQEYSDLLIENFQTEIQNIDFENHDYTVRKINEWFAENTENQITNAITGLPDDAQMVLANVIYFKGVWRYPFEVKRTAKSDFYAVDGTVQRVDFMTREDRFRFIEDEDLMSTLLELEYAGGEFRMIIILPHESVPITAVERLLIEDPNPIDIPDYGGRTVVSLPKFRVRASFDLIEPLMDAGVSEVFSSVADLSGITDDDLYVTQFFQEAVIEVDEEGTEAASVTGGIVSMSSGSPIIINRPFIFIIEHLRTKIPVFGGRVTKIPEFRYKHHYG